MKSFIKLLMAIIGILILNTSFAYKHNSEMFVSVVILSSCNVSTHYNKEDKRYNMNIISKCSHNNESYVTIQNIDEIKENTEYVLSNKKEILVEKNKDSDIYKLPNFSNTLNKDSQLVLVTISY